MTEGSSLLVLIANDVPWLIQADLSLKFKGLEKFMLKINSAITLIVMAYMPYIGNGGEKDGVYIL